LINPPSPTLTLSQSSIIGGAGASITGTVNLDGPAPAGGYVVSISSDNPAANVPTSVTVPAGARSATFTFNTDKVPADQTANITASANSFTSTVSLTILTLPVPPKPTIKLSRPSILGGLATSITGTVSLNKKAPAGGYVVDIASDSTATVGVPTSVIVPAGLSSVTFKFTTLAVASDTTANLSASAYSYTSSAPLLIQAPTVKSVVFSRRSIVRGSSNSATVTISGKAPVGGITLAISVVDPATGVTAPATLVIPAGLTSGRITVTTSRTMTPGTVTVSTTLNGVATNAQFTVTL
jgi:hypothetical protein